MVSHFDGRYSPQKTVLSSSHLSDFIILDGMLAQPFLFLYMALSTASAIIHTIIHLLNAAPPGATSSPPLLLSSLNSSSPAYVNENITITWKDLSGDADLAGCLDALASLQRRAGSNRKTRIKFFSNFYYPWRPYPSF